MEDRDQEQGITLIEIFNILYRNLILIIGVTLFITMLGIIYTFKFITPMYESTSDMMVQVKKSEGASSTNDYDLNTTLRLVQTISEFVEKDVVLEVVIEDLQLSMTTDEIRDGLKSNFNANVLFVNFKYRHADPKLAEAILNSIIDNAIDIANKNYKIIGETMKPVGDASIGKYASPNKTLNTIISLLLGGVLGVVIALLLEAFKTTVRNKKDLESLVPKYQVIGVIAQIPNKEKK